MTFDPKFMNTPYFPHPMIAVSNWAGHKWGRFKFQIGHGQYVFYLTPRKQIRPLKNFEVGLQTPQVPQTPYVVYGKGKKNENLKIIFAIVKMYSN